MTKKKKILIVIATILAIAIIAFVTMFCLWKSYYNRIWQPIIDSFISAGATETSYGSYCIRNSDFTAYATPPEFLKYGSNLQFSTPYEEYDKSKTQYSIDLLIWPEKDGTYKWGVTIDEIVSHGYYRSAASAYIDPDTLKTDLPTNSDLNDLYEEHREIIGDLVNSAKSVLGI